MKDPDLLFHAHFLWLICQGGKQADWGDGQRVRPLIPADWRDGQGGRPIIPAAERTATLGNSWGRLQSQAYKTAPTLDPPGPLGLGQSLAIFQNYSEYHNREASSLVLYNPGQQHQAVQSRHGWALMVLLLAKSGKRSSALGLHETLSSDLKSQSWKHSLLLGCFLYFPCAIFSTICNLVCWVKPAAQVQPVLNSTKTHLCAFTSVLRPLWEVWVSKTSPVSIKLWPLHWGHRSSSQLFVH